MHSLLESQIRTACLLEATAQKPGNVHPYAEFADLSYQDFVTSAIAVAESLTGARQLSLGKMILLAVQVTQSRLLRRTNPNLGMILLLAPLVAVPLESSLRSGLLSVLDALTVEDAKDVFLAISIAKPGGMGKIEDQDLTDVPTLPLLEIMRMASARDRIASEYSTGFEIVFDHGLPFLRTWSDFPTTWEQAIIALQLNLMWQFPDTLIARKCGMEVARESSLRAGTVLSRRPWFGELFLSELCRFDEWLRSDGHRRNPGTTADLIAASLFAAAREGMIIFPQHIVPSECGTYCGQDHSPGTE